MKPTLTPALSHRMGEGELSTVGMEHRMTKIAGRMSGNHEAFACCPPRPSDGRGVRGESKQKIK